MLYKNILTLTVSKQRKRGRILTVTPLFRYDAVKDAIAFTAVVKERDVKPTIAFCFRNGSIWLKYDPKAPLGEV